MNRLDHAVIGALVLALAVIAVAIGMPAVTPTAATATPTPIPVPPIEPYREGAIGRPYSVNPLAARTQVDRDLVALVFGGLVRLGPEGTLVGDMASRWTVDETGKTWVFTIRPDARWHDGTPVTSDDVVFTVDVMRDPSYTGPGAGSWREVAAIAVDARTVRFDLATPIGGFLHLATQAIAPAHLLRGVPVETLAEAPFGRTPVGSGSFTIVELDDDHAVLEPVTGSAPEASPVGIQSAPPPDPLATPTPTRRPSVAMPLLPRLEFTFFDAADDLAAAFRAGDVDVVSGLSPAAAAELSQVDGARPLRYPGTTLTTVILNLRPSHAELRDPAVRAALLAAIDRDAVVEAAFGGLAGRADSPIPPTSWAFDSAASPQTPSDPVAAANALTKAKWTKVDDRLRPPGAKEAYTVELVVLDAATNPTLHAVAEQVAADWDAIGLTVKLVEAQPGAFLSEYLREGKYTAAVIDVAIGHDPDLYPLLASSQTQTGGLNVMGLQDATLDGLLTAARKPGTDEVRKAAYTALQTQLAAGRYVLPIAFADEVVVVRDELDGPVVQPVADPSDRFWDVLTWRLANDR